MSEHRYEFKEPRESPAPGYVSAVKIVLIAVVLLTLVISVVMGTGGDGQSGGLRALGFALRAFER